jgi:hypothetical protein
MPAPGGPPINAPIAVPHAAELHPTVTIPRGIPMVISALGTSSNALLVNVAARVVVFFHAHTWTDADGGGSDSPWHFLFFPRRGKMRAPRFQKASFRLLMKSLVKFV